MSSPETPANAKGLETGADAGRRVIAEEVTEAVAVFHDLASFEAAADDLLNNGFDQSDLSVLAERETLVRRLGHAYQSTTELEDDPRAARVPYVPREVIGNAEGGIVAASIYLPLMLATGAVALSGGTALAAIGVALAAGGLGGTVGAALARRLGQRHMKYLTGHLSDGGIVLWVRACTPELQEKALSILRAHAAEDAHIHTLPPMVETDAERYAPVLAPERRIPY